MPCEEKHSQRTLTIPPIDYDEIVSGKNTATRVTNTASTMREDPNIKYCRVFILQIEIKFNLVSHVNIQLLSKHRYDTTSNTY